MALMIDLATGCLPSPRSLKSCFCNCATTPKQTAVGIASATREP